MPHRAAQHFTDAHVISRQLGGDGSAAAALGEGHLARDRGDLGTAARHYDQSRRWLTGQATPEWEAAALNGLGFTAALRANLDDADAYHRSAWQAAAPSPAAGARAAATALEGLAGVAAARGDGSRAAELLGTAARWRQWRHQPPLRREQHDIDRTTTQARDLLGEPAYRQAYTRGLQPPPGAVVDPEQPVDPNSPPGSANPSPAPDSSPQCDGRIALTWDLVLLGFLLLVQLDVRRVPTGPFPSPVGACGCRKLCTRHATC